MKITDHHLQARVINNNVANMTIAPYMLDRKSELLGSGGIIFDPENSESIADASLRLLYDPNLRSFTAFAENMLSMPLSREHLLTIRLNSFKRSGRAPSDEVLDNDMSPTPVVRTRLTQQERYR